VKPNTVNGTNQLAPRIILGVPTGLVTLNNNIILCGYPFNGTITLPYFSRWGGFLVITEDTSSHGGVQFSTIPYYVSFSMTIGVNTISRSNAGEPVTIQGRGQFVFLSLGY